MIDFEFKEKCYSCSACVQVCNVEAISYNEDLQPVIDFEKCKKCNKCERVCIELNAPEKSNNMDCITSFIVKNKNDEIRKMSSSGGVFFQVAQSVIKMGGYVCGCVYDEEFMPKHMVTNDIEICKQMMGSKYVKSDLKNCIKVMSSLIDDGNIVLFTGVPCQVAAVKSSIKHHNLITLAVVCHGSMGREVWKRYLSEEINISGKSIAKVSMRDKTKGYLNYGLRFQFDDGTEHITYRKQDGYFLKCFTDGLFERNRCLECEYKGNNILSDLLVGDAWGMEKELPDFVDDLGASAVLILTSQGKDIFDKVKKFFEIEYIDSEIIIKNNPRIILPSKRNVLQKGFEKKLNKPAANIHVLAKKYAKPTILNRLIWKIFKV